ncbi:hypothetical protein [Flavobacterium sp. N502540]|uniref:hypothetical protein n=1 Tax=Flavobacterium sp. N502540 TaxID=2986838 RepID=UPI0022242967|nr:hypothetical protein [Flavobacterium sp. N502540]
MKNLLSILKIDLSEKYMIPTEKRPDPNLSVSAKSYYYLTLKDSLFVLEQMV